MIYKKLIHKNFYGDYNILVTLSNDGTTPHRDTLIPDREIYDSHIWINDNYVKKCHAENTPFILDSFISNDELKRLFV